MFSTKKKLDRAYQQAKVIEFSDQDKFVLFSDCHRGNNSFGDEFARNRNTYLHALKYYYKEEFQYCELGDGDELWENLSFRPIFEAHKNVYQHLKLFHDKGDLHMIWGNHDMVYRDESYVAKNLYTYFDEKTGEETDLFCDIKYHEAIILKHKNTNQEVFLLHGHQADWWNYSFWRLSRFFVRLLWIPSQILGIPDPTSPAKNYKELIKVERRTKKWITDNNNIITVTGHTHRPRFPEPGDIAFFNDGSCVHPRSITGIEIENGAISLIKWQVITTDDGTLKVSRILLEGPQKLIDYKT